MDCTAENGARPAKRARLSPASEGVDLISGLDDDVLLRILAHLADARDAASTATLSRRWLHLWTRVPALRFVSRPAPTAAEPCVAAFKQYVSVVNGVLARRSQTNCAIESIAISYATDFEHVKNTEKLERRAMLKRAFAHAMQGWMQYVQAQHGLKSVVVDLPLPYPSESIYYASDSEDEDEDENENEDEDEDEEEEEEEVHVPYPPGFEFDVDSEEDQPEVLLDKLPRHACLETIHLALGGARIRLPTTMKFTSLVDLSLERIEILDPGAYHLLARLVSSATCPCLQKLRLGSIWLTDPSEEMRLEADELSELWIENLHVRTLQLNTPRLRNFHIDSCNNNELRILAPRMEEFAFFQFQMARGLPSTIGELSCVRSLKIRLSSDGDDDCGTQKDMNTKMLLIKQCSSVTCLDVTLECQQVPIDEMDMIRSMVPHLHGITSLTVTIPPECYGPHEYGASVASLLTRFSNLRSLSLHLLHSGQFKSKNPKCNHQDDWTSHDIYMTHLVELEFTGLAGTECELWFMEAVLASAKRLCKVTLSFHP